MKKPAFIFLIFILFVGITFGSQERTERPRLKTEIVTVKYINTTWVENILRKYLSAYGKIQYIPQGNKIIIEDTPEMMEKILSILKEIDVRPMDLQFNVELVLGSLTELELTSFDRDLNSDPVMKELRGLLKYKAFKRLDSSLIKVQDNSRSYQRIGGGGIDLKLNLRPRYIKEEKGDFFQVELRLSQFQGINKEGKEITLTLIDTTLPLKSGERSVVGVSKLNGGDKALILILSGKVIK